MTTSTSSTNAATARTCRASRYLTRGLMYSNLYLADDVSWVALHGVQALRHPDIDGYFTRRTEAEYLLIRKEYGHNG
jgi:hypothetical protein